MYKIYKTKSILNVHKHCDGGWFWHKYSAHSIPDASTLARIAMQGRKNIIPIKLKKTLMF